MPGQRRIAVQEEHGEAEPGGRPEGGDGAVQVGELEPEPAGEVVGRGHQSDRAEVHDDGAAIAAKRREPLPTRSPGAPGARCTYVIHALKVTAIVPTQRRS